MAMTTSSCEKLVSPTGYFGHFLRVLTSNLGPIRITVGLPHCHQNQTIYGVVVLPQKRQWNIWADRRLAWVVLYYKYFCWSSVTSFHPPISRLFLKKKKHLATSEHWQSSFHITFTSTISLLWISQPLHTQPYGHIHNISNAPSIEIKVSMSLSHPQVK
jgi:hypothetical protein